MTTPALPLRARIVLARLAEQEALQAVYRADILARGVVAVVAPHVPYGARTRGDVESKGD